MEPIVTAFGFLVFIFLMISLIVIGVKTIKIVPHATVMLV